MEFLSRHSALLAAGALLALTACGTLPVGTTAPDARDATPGAAVPGVDAPRLGFFSRIKAPDDREAVLRLAAKGAQVFRCEKREGGVWAFRQPDAQLLDAAGKVVGRHGANFSFEHNDGSRLLATIVAHDDAPKPTDLRWLLMTTRSFGKGAFENVTHVQRVNTSGGMPPASCDPAHAGRILRIDFTSDFVFYRVRAASAH